MTVTSPPEADTLLSMQIMGPRTAGGEGDVEPPAARLERGAETGQFFSFASFIGAGRFHFGFFLPGKLQDLPILVRASGEP